MSADEHLSRIDTLWSVVRRAHSPDEAGAVEAQELLLERYGGAIRRYLCACLRDRDAADEVFQEFALRFVRGDFQAADPNRGRFRAFVKTIVFRLMIDYRRRKGRDGRRQALVVEPAAHDAVDDPLADSDEVFLASWRDELLARAWRGLEEHEQATGSAYYTALRQRVEAPEIRSPELAARLTERLGRPITAENARVLVHRARDRFAELLLDAVAESIDDPAPDAIEEELLDLRLIDYCRDVLNKRRV